MKMLNNVPNKYKNLSENNKNVETKKGKTSLLEIRLNAQSTREGLEIREFKNTSQRICELQIKNNENQRRSFGVSVSSWRFVESLSKQFCPEQSNSK
jgi:hypothetical protein